MTDKAQVVLQKMKRRRLFRNPKARERILGEFNQSTLDDVGPVVGAEQGMKVLQEMNELGEAQELIIREGAPKISVL
jgi:hypothetical protein